MLSHQDLTIGDVCDRFDITRAAVKKHLNILEQGCLITVHAEGRSRVNRLQANSLQDVATWVNSFSEFWDSRLEKLKHVIEEGNNHE